MHPAHLPGRNLSRWREACLPSGYEIGRMWQYGTRKYIPLYIRMPYALAWESLYEMMRIRNLYFMSRKYQVWHSVLEQQLVEARMNILMGYARMDGDDVKWIKRIG